ncbi:serine/threonine-protein kinase 17B-like [Diadema antillarum]|uniref:serine/threonine-protein kinase 17B-like n=1 Tax=Diadema antillarum TaxID=105358 RepID=UPI003A8C7E34
MPLREVQIMNRSRVVPEGTTRRYRDGNFHNSYTTLNELGRGRFAVVRKCKHKETSRHFAAKFVRKRKMGRDCREDILKEIRILESSTLNPRLIGLHEVYETSTEVILVLEYMASYLTARVAAVSSTFTMVMGFKGATLAFAAMNAVLKLPGVRSSCLVLEVAPG